MRRTRPFAHGGGWQARRRVACRQRRGYGRGHYPAVAGRGSVSTREEAPWAVVEAHLLLGALSRGLDAVPALDHIGLEAYRARTAVQLEEQAAGVAQDGANLIAAPERGGAGGAVLADGLLVVVSESGHVDGGFWVLR